jgi:hypothetical protein
VKSFQAGAKPLIVLVEMLRQKSGLPHRVNPGRMASFPRGANYTPTLLSSFDYIESMALHFP